MTIRKGMSRKEHSLWLSEQVDKIFEEYKNDKTLTSYGLSIKYGVNYFFIARSFAKSQIYIPAGLPRDFLDARISKNKKLLTQS